MQFESRSEPRAPAGCSESVTADPAPKGGGGGDRPI